MLGVGGVGRQQFRVPVVFLLTGRALADVGPFVACRRVRIAEKAKYSLTWAYRSRIATGTQDTVVRHEHDCRAATAKRYRGEAAMLPPSTGSTAPVVRSATASANSASATSSTVTSAPSRFARK